MSRKELKIAGVLAVCAAIYLSIVSGCSTNKSHPTPQISVPTNAAALNLPHRTPAANDGRIAYVTARLMEEFHYSQQPLDMEMSKKFFDGYIDSLDPRHENFLQSDLAEFQGYRTNLDNFTIGGRGTADLTPSYTIFSRFLKRAEQHFDYVNELLADGKFKFTGDDGYEIDRRHSPFPKDLDQAKELWRERLRYEYLQEKLNDEISPTNAEAILPLTKTNYADIMETLSRHYAWSFHQTTNMDSTDVLQLYLNGLTHAYDPHSDYLNNEHAQDFSIQMSLSLFGIGAQLVEDDGYCTIRELIPGGPAAASKQLNPQDRIISVAQSNKPPVDVVGMDLGKVVQLIRGPKGTQVRLTISPLQDRAARKVVSLTRQEIKLEDSEAKAELIEMPDNHGGTNRIGVINLPSFYATIDLPGSGAHSIKSTSADVAKLLKKLKEEHVAGVIIDLRNNGGGSLEEARKFVGLFIKDGPVVLSRSPDGTIGEEVDDDPAIQYAGPLVVLVNRFSASASEIAAGALQDYGRALIVGDKSTFGKGTVQNLNPLAPIVLLNSKATNDPGTVKITIRKFYRVSGASTQLRGVSSDIVLPDVLNRLPDIGESGLPNALPWDTIPPVFYDKLNLTPPALVADLAARSTERVATNRDFNYISQDIAEQERMRTNKTVSLNEKDEIKERQRIAKMNKVREDERANRDPLPQKIYDITVENAGQPGLTPAVENDETNSVTVAGTNTMSSAVAKKLPPPFDPWLIETENILEDYISMSSTNSQPKLAHQL
ncbi:MAG TPA: carboxy terminal-processing peptidase [Verrucomicrobiae bacterium]|nr:carboxy terminal-processing peptidase [Verrucomicrobiae bacterium]